MSSNRGYYGLSKHLRKSGFSKSSKVRICRTRLTENTGGGRPRRMGKNRVSEDAGNIGAANLMANETRESRGPLVGLLMKYSS